MEKIPLSDIMSVTPYTDNHLLVFLHSLRMGIEARLVEFQDGMAIIDNIKPVVRPIKTAQDAHSKAG